MRESTARHAKCFMGEKIVRISAQRKMIGENLKNSILSYPQTRGFCNVDMSGIFALKADLAAKGKKVTMSAFFIKAVAMALTQHPKLNARMEDGHFVYYDVVNVGISVDTPKGLMVPVVKDAEKKSLPEISDEVRSIRKAIDNREITIDAFRGGTVTISSVSDGRMDSIVSIINNSEALIIGFARTRKLPVVDENDQIVVRPICTMTINLNHYIADGGEQSAYSTTLCDYLEHPEKML